MSPPGRGIFREKLCLKFLILRLICQGFVLYWFVLRFEKLKVFFIKKGQASGSILLLPNCIIYLESLAAPGFVIGWYQGYYSSAQLWIHPLSNWEKSSIGNAGTCRSFNIKSFISKDWDAIINEISAHKLSCIRRLTLWSTVPVHMVGQRVRKYVTHTQRHASWF